MICTVTDSIDFSQQITKCNPCFNFCAIDWRRYTTLKEETFAVFSQIRESLFPRNFSKDVIRESFFPRNFLKKSSSANILKKYAFVIIISNYCGIRKI